MINIARFTFNIFSENTYVIWDGNGEAVIIDAGCSNTAEQESLAEFIRTKGIKPVLALNTHAHPDHMAGVGFVIDRYSVPFAVSSDDSALLAQMPQTGLKYNFRIPQITIDRDLKTEHRIAFGQTAIEVIPSPGHSEGSVCFYIEQSGVLFSGDTLFRGSIGRTDLPGGDYDVLMHSILDNLLPLGRDVKVYPGHGETTSIGNEADSNPFITEVLDGGFNKPYNEDEN